MFIGANKCSRCGGCDANCYVCRDIPEERPKPKPRMNSLEKNSLEILRTDARILDAKIEIVDRHCDQLRIMHEDASEELKRLKQERNQLNATARTITGQ